MLSCFISDLGDALTKLGLLVNKAYYILEAGNFVSISPLISFMGKVQKNAPLANNSTNPFKISKHQNPSHDVPKGLS